ncbi:MAG TPA: hypothetical protein VKU02_29880 [Gemmataceae bacterium]|nr:hypothetical protein [Gemmataceae bacterium]
MPQTGRLGLVVLFVLDYGMIISMDGGGSSTIPAYLRDLFGATQVGAIHDHALTASSAAGIAGPVLLNYIRKYPIEQGVPKAEAYTITIYIMADLLMGGFVCNLLVAQPPSCDTRAERRCARAWDTEEIRGWPREIRGSDTLPAGTVPLHIFSGLSIGVPLACGVLETL